jgi:hypothetical protein
MAPTDLVAVVTLINHYDVEMALSALRAARIDAFAQTEDRNRPHLAMGGVRILVRAEDAPRAREILQST